MRYIFTCCLLITGFVKIASAQPTPTYYNGTANQSCATLKATLKNIITNGNVLMPYGDLYLQYALTDKKPRTVGTGSLDVVWDIYSTRPNGTDPYQYSFTERCGSYSREGDCFNREHSVPQSWFNGNTSLPGPATDYLHVFPTDGFVNGKRSNFPYGEVGSTVSYTSLNGSKLGSSAVAGITGTVFEPIDEYKGDVARAFLYFVTRYENDMPSFAVNNESKQAFDGNSFPSVKVSYLQLMLKWHRQDPVSEKERIRNNGSFSFQGNRNPFVDSPQFVNRVWNNTCPGLSSLLPADILLFSAKLQGANVVLNWDVANEINMLKYEVELSFNGVNYQKISEVAASNAKTYSFSHDVNNLKGNTIFYRLKKVDVDGSFSFSEVVSVNLPVHQSIAIYPNPADKFAVLQVGNTMQGVINVSIAQLNGTILQTQQLVINSGKAILPVSKLPTGTYFVHIANGKSTSVHKLVVSH